MAPLTFNTVNGSGPGGVLNYLNFVSGAITFNINVPASITSQAAFRFRVTDVCAQSGDQPTSQAPNGEVEDYLIPIIPLSVTLGWVLAETNGDTVDFQWQTATESGVAGFNLLVETESGLVQLNEALIASPAIDSVTPTDYQASFETVATLFYLQEVGIDGHITTHGPFVVGEETGSSSGPDDAVVVPTIWLPLVSSR